VQDKEKNKETR